jgi:hypothetical protein
MAEICMSMVVIPAKAGYVLKRKRCPGKDWMPDHVRCDAVGTFCCQSNQSMSPNNLWILVQADAATMLKSRRSIATSRISAAQNQMTGLKDTICGALTKKGP